MLPQAGVTKQPPPPSTTVEVMTLTANQWVERFAAALGTAAPTEEEQGFLLALAGVAAHTSERTAAPISCWLAARAGVSPADACRAGQELARKIGDAG